MIDVLNEEIIDLRQACKEPSFRNSRTGSPAHIATVYRYILRGAAAANGDRVKLESVKTPSGIRTSREAIGRFIDRLTNPGRIEPQANAKVRQREIDRAEQELREAGLLA